MYYQQKTAQSDEGRRKGRDIENDKKQVADCTATLGLFGLDN